VAQEPEGSSSHSQQTATGPCPEPVESNQHSQANLPKIHSDTIFPPTPWSSKWSPSLGLSHQNLVHFSLLSHACHMPRPPHSLGWRGGIAPTHSTSTLDGGEWSASRPGRALAPGKGPLVPTEQEAGWTPEPVWTQRLQEKSFRLCRNRTSIARSSSP
jgi:hypothetical protein